MEEPMTFSIFATAARRAVLSTLTALILAAALPQAGFAANDDGIWKVNPAQSSFSANSATLSIERVAAANPATGSFIVISNGNVFRVTRATASDSKGIQPVDYARMAKQPNAMLIGSKAHSAEPCGFRCQGNLPEAHMTLTFRVVSGAEKQINDMLAEGK